MTSLWTQTVEQYANNHQPFMSAAVALMESDHALSTILAELPPQANTYGYMIAQHRIRAGRMTEKDYHTIVKHDMHLGYVHDPVVAATLQPYVPIWHLDWHNMVVERHPHLSKQYLRQYWTDEQLYHIVAHDISPINYKLSHAKIWTKLFCELPHSLLQKIAVHHMRNIFFQLESTEYMTSDFIHQCEQHTSFMDLLKTIRLPIEIASLFQQTMSVSPRALRSLSEIKNYMNVFKREPSYILAFTQIDNVRLYSEDIFFLKELTTFIPKNIFDLWIQNKRFAINTPLSWLPEIYIPERLKAKAADFTRIPVIDALLPWYKEQYQIDLLIPNDDMYLGRPTYPAIPIPFSVFDEWYGKSQVHIEEINISI